MPGPSVQSRWVRRDLLVLILAASMVEVGSSHVGWRLHHMRGGDASAEHAMTRPVKSARQTNTDLGSVSNGLLEMRAMHKSVKVRTLSAINPAVLKPVGLAFRWSSKGLHGMPTLPLGSVRNDQR